jgi:hypothetical protein
MEKGKTHLVCYNKTANYTTLASDETILVDATAGNITITLLVTSGNSGKSLQ